MTGQFPSGDRTPSFRWSPNLIKKNGYVSLFVLLATSLCVTSQTINSRAASSSSQLQIVECEGKGCTPGKPGSVTWTFSNLQRTGLWTPGDQQVSIVHLDHDSIAIHRLDVNGSSKGITAMYLGKIVGNRILGTVVYYPPEPKLHPDTDA